MHGIAPLITPMAPDVTVKNSENVTFHCRSNEPIHWELAWTAQMEEVTASASNSNEHYNGLFHYVQTELPTAGNCYEIQLNLINVNYFFVGFYYCIKNSSASSNLETKLQNNLASKIYLFVQGLDF